MGRKSTKELEQLITAQLRGETVQLGEVAETQQGEQVERRLDKRISKGSGAGGSAPTG